MSLAVSLADDIVCAWPCYRFPGACLQITTVDEASQFYPLFGLGANVALIFSGRAVKIFSQIRAELPPDVDGWGLSLRGLMGMVVIGGFLIAGAQQRYAAKWLWGLLNTLAVPCWESQQPCLFGVCWGSLIDAGCHVAHHLLLAWQAVL